MSPDRRPGLVLSKRRFIEGSAGTLATLLLAACGKTPDTSKAVVQEITPVPVVIPISLSEAIKDVTPVLKEPAQNIVIKEDPVISVLKRQLVIQQAIIEANNEPTKVRIPTRTPVFAKPALPAAATKPAVKSLDDEAREQVYNIWLDGMNIKPSIASQPGAEWIPRLHSLETSFYDTRTTGEALNRNEVVRRILSKPEQLDTKLQWTSISSGISSSVRKYTVVKGLLELNNPNIQILALPVLPSDRPNGIEYRGSALLQLANRGRQASFRGASINQEFGVSEGSFGKWKTSSVIIPFMKKQGIWQRIEEIHMSAFGQLPSKYSLSVFENWEFLPLTCPENKVCTYEI